MTAHKTKNILIGLICIATTLVGGDYQKASPKPIISCTALRDRTITYCKNLGAHLTIPGVMVVGVNAVSYCMGLYAQNRAMALSSSGATDMRIEQDTDTSLTLLELGAGMITVGITCHLLNKHSTPVYTQQSHTQQACALSRKFPWAPRVLGTLTSIGTAVTAGIYLGILCISPYNNERGYVPSSFSHSEIRASIAQIYHVLHSTGISLSTCASLLYGTALALGEDNREQRNFGERQQTASDSGDSSEEV